MRAAQGFAFSKDEMDDLKSEIAALEAEFAAENGSISSETSGCSPSTGSPDTALIYGSSSKI
jgi:hypothetical protein